MTIPFSPWTFFLIFGRTSTLVAFFPIISESSVPRMVRFSLAVWLSLAMLPLVPVNAFVPATLSDLALAMGIECVIGALFAFVARFVFAGIMLGVHWIDAEIGFQAAQQINPLSGVPGSPIATLILVVVSLLFFCLGYFEQLIFQWGQIFKLLPPPVMYLPMETADVMVSLSSRLFVKALELATPILVVMFMVTLAIGLFARAIQGISIFVESYTLKILIGLSTLVAIAPLLIQLLRNNLDSIEDSWSLLIHVLRSN
jgi:flagellar biosynthesis protein FliR